MTKEAAVSKQTTVTFEEFEEHGRSGPVSVFSKLLDELRESEPVPVTVGAADLYQRRNSLYQVANKRFGSGRVAVRLIDGTLYACLMPSEDANSTA